MNVDEIIKIRRSIMTEICMRWRVALCTSDHVAVFCFVCCQCFQRFRVCADLIREFVLQLCLEYVIVEDF